MKSFYEWYRKHITGAIFGGLILGILTGREELRRIYFTGNTDHDSGRKRQHSY